MCSNWQTGNRLVQGKFTELYLPAGNIFCNIASHVVLLLGPSPTLSLTVRTEGAFCAAVCSASLRVQEKPARHHHLVSSVCEKEWNKQVSRHHHLVSSVCEKEWNQQAEKATSRERDGGEGGDAWLACPAPARKQKQLLSCQQQQNVANAELFLVIVSWFGTYGVMMRLNFGVAEVVARARIWTHNLCGNDGAEVWCC